MKVILLCDVKNQGKKDSIIEVSDGYANNYLIKNNLAVAYSKRSNEILTNKLDKLNKEEEALVESLNEIRKKLENKNIVFKVKTGAQDKVFGTISSKQISEKLKEMGYKIDKKCIKLDTPVSSLGVTQVKLELHKRVVFNINIELVK
ncbi:50S ribosomal protein L9 [bacterium]|nr:50S ribosomal protein L9 [bacterium]